MGSVERGPSPRWAAVVRGGLGAGCVLVPGWAAATRWSTLVAGHPAYPVLLGALASRARLPAGTAFTAVPGAVHAFFGDYGPQDGDGTPGTSRAQAQRQIVEATERFVATLS